MRIIMLIVGGLILVGRLSGQGNAVNAALAYPPGVKSPYPLAVIGDIDCDGVDDFALGSQFDSTIASSSGAVRALSGRTGAVLWSDFGPAMVASMGYAVASVGDFDADGFNEIAAGVPYGGSATVNPALPPGFVRVYHGATGTLLLTLTASSNPGGFGSSIVRIADLDADGIDDVAIGRPALPYQFSLLPGIDVYSGATLTFLQSFTLQSPFVAGTAFGAGMVGGEDVNGDGVADLVVSAPWWLQGGAVFAFSGTDFSLLWMSDVGQPNPVLWCGCERLGEQIDFLLDFDGDGVRDLWASLLNSPNPPYAQARIISGATGTTITQFAAANGYGVRSLSVMPDQNGDGIRDIMSVDSLGSLNAYASPAFTPLGPLPCQTAQMVPQLCGAWVGISDLIDLDHNGVDEWILFRAVQGAGTYEVTTYGPSFAVPAASGAFPPSGSVPFQPLRVNGSTGGFTRRIAIGTFDPVTIAIQTEPGAPTTAPFVLWGTFGSPTVNDTINGPLGSLSFFPASAAPGVPWLFTVTNNIFPDPTSILVSAPAPWSMSIVNGIPYPLDFTLQGLMFDAALQPRVTNAVLVSVN